MATLEAAVAHVSDLAKQFQRAVRAGRIADFDAFADESLDDEDDDDDSDA